ncbi:MAG: hypothetical protein AB1400_07850 [Pseudomonadota bacterium]
MLFRRLFAAVLLAALTACAAVPLQRGQTAQLTQDAPADEVEKVFGKATVTATHEFDFQDKHFRARHYNLQTGSKQEMSMSCTQYGCFPVFYTVAVTAPYVVVYNTGTKKLVAWGLVEELSRSPDESVSAMMPALKESHAKAVAEKKK